MARSSFLFRTDPRTLAALRRWADDDLRSMNAQLEFIVRRALKEAGRLPGPEAPEQSPEDAPE